MPNPELRPAEARHTIRRMEKAILAKVLKDMTMELFKETLSRSEEESREGEEKEE